MNFISCFFSNKCTVGNIFLFLVTIIVIILCIVLIFKVKRSKIPHIKPKKSKPIKKIKPIKSKPKKKFKKSKIQKKIEAMTPEQGLQLIIDKYGYGDNVDIYKIFPNDITKITKLRKLIQERSDHFVISDDIIWKITPSKKEKEQEEEYKQDIQKAGDELQIVSDLASELNVELPDTDSDTDEEQGFDINPFEINPFEPGSD